MRIVAVPSAHRYVARIVPDMPGSRGEVVRLPDPLPVPAPPDPAVWWPPRALEPDWIAKHSDDFDLVHVHFGFEGRTPRQLRDWTTTLDSVGKPLVLTVHDLENPHLVEQSGHTSSLDVLVPAAAAVLTLTSGAALEIARRWGVDPTIVPHPQLVEDAEIARSDVLRSAHSAGSPRLGLPLGAIRAGTDPTRWLAPLVAAADACGAVIEASATDAMRPERLGNDARRRHIVETVAATLRARHRLVYRPRLPDSALNDWLSDVDVLVLPYVHGTHSGWIEHAWDLGASVLTPRVGYIAEQHDDPLFLSVFDPDDPGDLGLPALLAARAGGVPWGASGCRMRRRRAQLHEVRALHARVYAHVLSAGRR